MADLKKFALIAEIIGGAGIIVSMIYLAYQVSQNTANLQVANALAISSELNSVRALHIENREAHEFIYKAWTDYESLDESERFRFTAYALHRFSVWENLVLMEEEGLLPEGFGDLTGESLCTLMRSPAFVSVWERSGGDYRTRQLVERVEACIGSDSTGTTVVPEE